jgi:DNA-directed RNA polymerase subunit H (RpoH/RPB5)
MEKISKKYGAIFNEEEIDLVIKSLGLAVKNIYDITHDEPKDLAKLHGALITIKRKGYMKIHEDNQVTEEDIKGRICEECE